MFRLAFREDIRKNQRPVFLAHVSWVGHRLIDSSGTGALTTKVAMIADYPDAGQPIDGGVQAVTTYLVESFAGLDEIDLYIVSFRDGLDGVCVRKRPKCTQYLAPFGGLGLLSNFRADQRLLDRCLDEIRPDVVHSQGGGHHGILASRCGYPAVTTIHGIHRQEAAFKSNLRERIRKRAQAWLSEHYCIRRAKHTILISPYVADYFGGSLTGERHLIPNPVGGRFFEVVRQPRSSKILFLGRLYALKGVHDLVYAASELGDFPTVEIVLAGAMTDSGYVAQLKSIVGKLNMGDRVVFRGVIDSDRLLHELATCTCLVLPSYQETAPMVVQESMAAGVPVIASNICGIPYQIDHGQTGLLFPPGDRNALTECLRSVLSDSELRTHLSNSARLKAKSEYTADAVARRTLDVYLSMLS